MDSERLRRALARLYEMKTFVPRVWTDDSDPAFLCVHMIERSVSELAPRLQGEIIDVGCGQQPYRTYFRHAIKITACDFDATRGEVDFACHAHDIPVSSGSFDSVLCTEVLEHVPDPLAVWKEFYRILRPGGRVLLTTPMYWPPHELPYDFYRYPEHGLRHLAIAAGFDVEEVFPRGGMWLFLGQAAMHVAGHYLKAGWMRRLWNRLWLRVDRSRRNPSITAGWTMLARKPSACSESLKSESPKA